MYKTIDDFLTHWNEEMKMTINLFETLTEESLNQKVYRQGRELGQLVWHIVQTVSELGHSMGLLEHDTLKEQKLPPFLPAVIACYRGASNHLIEAIKQKWKDSDLAEKIPIYGENWERNRCLQVLVSHQIHHRGQMTVLMRQAGLKVLGLYGPSKEEWKQMGLPAPI